MTRPRMGLIGICVAVSALMVMFANSAQAAFSWLVLNSEGTINTEVKEEGGVVNLLALLLGKKDSNHLVLLAETLSMKLNITCANFALINFNLEKSGKLSNGKIRYTECEAYEKAPLTNALACHLHTSGGPEGIIETNEIKTELILHTLTGGGTEVLARSEPAGTQFVTILTEKCILPESNKIGGFFYFKDCLKKATTHEIEHLVEQGPLTSLIYGSDSAEHLLVAVDGSGWVYLGTPHLGLKWAAMDV